MTKKIAFGIIGCGRIGSRHAQHIVKNGSLVAACDIIQGNAQKITAEFGGESFDDVDTMLKRKPPLDVIAVCSPNGLHAEHTIKSLKAGYHVLCEKPMALSVHDCGEMIKTAENTNRRLFIVKQNRFNPPVAAIKKAIDEGRFGKIYSIQLSCFWNRNEDYYKNSWKGTKNLDGGTHYTQFSHFIDLLYWMIGDIRTVQAFAGNFHHNNIIEFEDT